MMSVGLYRHSADLLRNCLVYVRYRENNDQGQVTRRSNWFLGIILQIKQVKACEKRQRIGATEFKAQLLFPGEVGQNNAVGQLALLPSLQTSCDDGDIVVAKRTIRIKTKHKDDGKTD